MCANVQSKQIAPTRDSAYTNRGILETPIMAQVRRMIRLSFILKDATANIVAIMNHNNPNAATGIPMN